MADEFVLIEREDGTWIERPKPYAIVECKTKEDYDMLMRLVERGRNSEWIDPAIELPVDPKQLVLVIVSGRYNNITFKHAYELANYFPGEGWVLEQYPSWESPQISHWTLLPEMPEVMHEKL